MPSEDWSDPNVLSKAVTRKPGKAIRRTVDNYNRATKPKLPLGKPKKNVVGKLVSISAASFLLCVVVFGNKALGQVCGVMGMPLQDVDRVMYFLSAFGLVNALLPNSLDL